MVSFVWLIYIESDIHVEVFLPESHIRCYLTICAVALKISILAPSLGAEMFDSVPT